MPDQRYHLSISGSIPQFIPAELFKTGPRPPAMSIGGFLNWLCNFIIAIGYPPFEVRALPQKKPKKVLVKMCSKF